jgi:hypothetical protein
MLAHRLSWELHFGPIPEGKCVCHHCDTPACIRPDHLFLGTPKDNTSDMINKGRRSPLAGFASGEASPRAKLTASQVKEIRARCNESGPRLAVEYGVTSGTVYGIWRHRIWRTVD